MAMSEAYRNYLRSPHWQEIRRKALDRADGACENCQCPRPDSELNVHHKTYERLGDEDMRDLEVLCGVCHDMRHPGWNYERNRPQCYRCGRKLSGKNPRNALINHLRDKHGAESYRNP